MILLSMSVAHGKSSLILSLSQLVNEYPTIIPIIVLFLFLGVRLERVEHPLQQTVKQLSRPHPSGGAHPLQQTVKQLSHHHPNGGGEPAITDYFRKGLIW